MVGALRWLLLLPLLLGVGIPAGAVTPGTPAPGIEAKSLRGPERIRLQDFHGKVVYLDFWASWCAPCRLSLPWMETLRQDFAPAGFEVLAVNVDEDPADGARFLMRFALTYPVLEDPLGAVAAAYDVKEMPSSYLIDRKGVVRMVHAGFNSRDATRLREAVAALVGERPP